MSIIPGLNYDGKLSVQDLAFQQEEFEKAVLDRIKLVFGTDSLLNPKYGVVDVLNPRDLVSSETTRPLLVYASTNNTLAINVTSGTAISQSGAVIRNQTLVEDLELTRTTANDILIVFLENEIEDSGPYRKTRYNVNQPTRQTQNKNVIRSVLLSEFNNAVIFTPKRLENIVVLAVITVVPTATSSLELQFDYTGNSYSFNRPWFSPVDAEHRSYVGSGLITASNPHGMTINDLSSGDMAFYNQLLSIGQVVARDDDIHGVPGSTCTETITTSRVLTDSTGTVTAESRFGGIGANYVVLSKYPLGVTAFYLQSHKGRGISFDIIAGTKILVLPYPESLTGTAVIEYTEVFALAPPAQILSNVLSFGQPSTAKELVITGGSALTELINPFIDFDGTGPVPRNYTLYANPDGTIIRSPQTVQAPFKLDDIGTSYTIISASMFGNARLSVGLANASSSPTMTISMRLYGKDINGNTVTEDVSFSGPTWVGVTLPGYENSKQYVKTSNLFSAISAVQVLSRTDDGPNSVVQIWAELETETTQALNKLASVASLSWDGLAIQRLKDKRKVVVSIPEPDHRFLSAAEWNGLGGTEDTLLLSEDFGMPKYRESTDGTQEATNATFSVVFGDTTLINGDTITISPTSKTATATTGVPNRATGQYQNSASQEDTRDDLVLTLNDLSFNSGVLAVADGVLTNKVNCTITQYAGARGNGNVTTSSVEIVVTNATGGIDTYGENFTPRHQDYIESSVPSPSTYEITDIRYRYRSIPIPVDGKTKIVAVVHRLAPPYTNCQVRVRVALGVDSEWQPWEVATANGAVFTITKGSNIYKCQVEIFGKCSGFSLFEGN